MCTQTWFSSCNGILKYKLKLKLTNPTFNLYFNIPSQLENPIYVHISNGLFYPVLLHIHCKQLGSQLAFYESIYVRSIFLN